MKKRTPQRLKRKNPEGRFKRPKKAGGEDSATASASVGGIVEYATLAATPMRKLTTDPWEYWG